MPILRTGRKRTQWVPVIRGRKTQRWVSFRVQSLWLVMIVLNKNSGLDVKQAPSEDAIVLSYSWILNVVISFISSYHPQTLFILNASIPALISPASFHLPAFSWFLPHSNLPTHGEPFSSTSFIIHLYSWTSQSLPLSGFLIPRSPIPLIFYKRIW